MLSLQEHQKLGGDLFEAFEIMRTSKTFLNKKYSQNSDQAKMALEAQELIRKLRFLMDDIAFRELPKETEKTVSRLYCHQNEKCS
jgi:hypothetical protein